MCFLIVLFVALIPSSLLMILCHLFLSYFNFEHAFEKQNYDHENEICFWSHSPLPLLPPIRIHENSKLTLYLQQLHLVSN